MVNILHDFDDRGKHFNKELFWYEQKSWELFV